MKHGTWSAIIVTGAAALALAGCGTAAYSVPPQPPDAAQVARILGATGFKAMAAGVSIGVVSGGTAIWHGKLIGIDTFASHAALQDWLPAAEELGVVPSAEGATWVAYPSVSGS